MTDVRKNWFFQQHFTEEELEKIHQWNQVSEKALTAQMVNGRFGGFHIEDKSRSLLLVAMEDKEMCENWIRRLGFKISNEKIEL